MWRYVGIAASLALFGAALVALHHVLAEIHLADVLARFHDTPTLSILLALTCVVGSYITLTGYDVLALRHLGKSVPYSRTALASFTSYTFSHNIGLSLIAGGSIRYRVYSAEGLSAAEIATLVGICAITFALGVSLLLGLALLFEPAVLSVTDTLPPIVNRTLGVAILAVVAGYAAWTGLRRGPLTLKAWSFQPPRLPMTLVQLAIGAVDIGFAAGALYLVLPTDIGIGYVPFLGVYVAAMTIGVLSHAPGGLGVFEAVVLLTLPGADQGALLGALLMYRCLYYLLPLAVAAALLAWNEARIRRRAFDPGLRAIRRLVHSVAPPTIGAAVFAGGAILLFSAATPALDDRMAILRHVLPLPFVEASHLFSSIIGIGLMILARGLFRRLDGAWNLTVAMLCGGIAFSLLKGLDYEEAVILAGVLTALAASRPAFYRKASLANQQFSAAWTATIAAIVAAAVWLGLFAFKHVEYSDALWWEFAYRGDAPRFLRASVAVVALAVGLLVFLLLRPARPGDDAGGITADALRRIVASSPRPEANLALTGDKRFLVSAQEDGLLMYGVKGRSWVALGEPVGPEAAWESLLWRFRELCDRHGGWPVFYQVRVESLPRFLDLGLSLLKLGETARVDLETFSLDGGNRRGLRQSDRRAVKDGVTFDVVPAANLPGILPDLRAVSDAWLRSRSTHEKGFSVGAFSEDYMLNFDCAVVRQGGLIVAFANLWQAPVGRELSVDLMRHLGGAPPGVMDFLFIRLMLWGKEKGYKWFDLGMAPLSGLEAHPLAPVWNRIGAFTFRHGEHFFNFEGLRAYKEKFDPEWTPRYLAAPGGLALPRILLDVAALISGGTGEIFRK